MSTFLRKAMWPAALIVGMFVLIGAIGTATAPTASAAANDVCAIYGPFPDFSGLGTDNPNDLLIESNEYLFIIAVEDQVVTAGTVDVSIDDETSRVGLTGYNAATTETSLTVLGSTDSVNLAVNAELTTYDPDYIGDLEDQFYVDLTDYADTCGVVPDPDGLTFVTIDCARDGTFEVTANETGVTDNVATEGFECVNPPSAITLTATPGTVESYPAIGNISHSLLIATLTDGSGHYVSEDYEIDWATTSCVVEPLDQGEFDDAILDFNAWSASMTPYNAAQIELAGATSGWTGTAVSYSFNENPSGALGFGSYAAAVLHCEGEDPGVATITVSVDNDQSFEGIEMGPSKDLKATADVVIVGPPAFITMTAAPEELVCGEKATILVTITDAINQNVSDHTRVELITNYGGVIGGTGSSLGFPGVNPVNPLSSSAAETFGGVATAYLLTSTNHVGPYEVVAAAGGSYLGGYDVFAGYNSINESQVPLFYTGGGQFSTPVVTSQVTVTCHVAEEPEVTAPDTGTGTISPPNTGDAGLAAGSSSATFVVIAGAVAFVLAGFAKFGFARRS